jgi:hypothetical protein
VFESSWIGEKSPHLSFPVVKVYAILAFMQPHNVEAIDDQPTNQPIAGQDAKSRLRHCLSNLSLKLKRVGLDHFVGAVLDAAEPFGPLGAQLLWVAQPMLSLVVPREELGDLARLLDAPEGVAWFRSELLSADLSNVSDSFTGMEDSDKD